MSDIFNKEKRSKIMGSVKGKNTKPEIQLRKSLHALGFRFRIHDKKLPGSPDIKLPKYKTVIFVNGCFWHGHDNCKYYTIPKSNNKYWVNKIEENIGRDLKNYENLKKIGWRVIVVWTCELHKKLMEIKIDQIVKQLSQAHK